MKTVESLRVPWVRIPPPPSGKFKKSFENRLTKLGASSIISFVMARRDDREAEGAPLLREYTGDRIEGSNPSLSVCAVSSAG